MPLPYLDDIPRVCDWLMEEFHGLSAAHGGEPLDFVPHLLNQKYEQIEAIVDADHSWLSEDRDKPR